MKDTESKQLSQAAYLMTLNSRQRRKLEAQHFNGQRRASELIGSNLWYSSYLKGVPPQYDVRFPEGLRKELPNKYGKGTRAGRCNVNACQTDRSAWYYHNVMRAYYCYFCARDIHQANPDSEFFTDYAGKRRGRVPSELNITREEFENGQK